MNTPVLDKIRCFYESVPSFKVTYTLTLVSNGDTQYYDKTDDEPDVYTTAIQSLNPTVGKLVCVSLSRRLDGAINVEESMRRCREHLVQQVFNRIYQCNLRCSRSILDNKNEAAEDCAAYLMHEATLSPEMKKHLLKSMIKKYGDKK